MLSGYGRLALRRKVIVNLDSGRAIRGILYEQRGDLVEIRNAEIVEPGMNPVPAAGAIVIERARIEFVQVLQG